MRGARRRHLDWALTLCPAMALSAMSHSTEIVEATTRPFDIREAHDRMAAAMRARGRVLVAFSGGVDSGLVARVAHDALGDNAVAVLADAESSRAGNSPRPFQKPRRLEFASRPSASPSSRTIGTLRTRRTDAISVARSLGPR